jgi:putative membrane-bound dehydrogenase-like protein
MSISLALTALFAFVDRCAAQGFSPEAARARMTLPPGFSAQVFASEPDIRQPVAACFDERGRMWVIEYLQYPVPAGLKPVTVDQYLRTEYDRVPEPPPRGPRGADRIKILEDTDGDGRADKVTTFVEGLNLASGLAVGHGGVFVGQAPYLLFYADKNKDDKPDGDPEVLLSGFGLQDAHATVNSMMWGPDGWLYGAQGSTVTAKIRGIEFQQGIWRYHPRTKMFELFAEGGGNTWGLDFDRAGHAFGSSNGGYVSFHMVQGGYYLKGFAKHGPLHNPNTFGYFNQLEYVGPKHGGHVTPGGIIYKGDAYPEEFRGAFIGGNLLSNAVYWHKLGPKGSTFNARHRGTLIDSHDTWFRPIDLLTGPDGSVFVVDWYDKRASHLDPRDNWDKSNGRIYKVVHEGTKRVAPFDLGRLESADLVALRTKENDWWPETARRILAERRDPRVIPLLKSLLLDDRDQTLALRDFWDLYVSGGFDAELATRLLDHPLAGVRRWAIRLSGDDCGTPPARLSRELVAKLNDVALHDPDAAVRSQLASSCQRFPADDALSLLMKLASRSEDRADPHIPLLLWWGLEHLMRDHAERVVEAFGSSTSQSLPLVREQLTERIVRMLVSHGANPRFNLCAQMLANAPSDLERERIVSGMEKGLEGQHFDRVPIPLEQPLEGLWNRGRPSLAQVKLGIRLGSERASREALKRAADTHVSESERSDLIDVFGQSARPGALAGLLALFRRERSQAVQSALLSALARYQSDTVGSDLLNEYQALNPALRDRVRDLMCSRRPWAGTLLDAMESGTIPARDLKPLQALMITQLGDQELLARLEKAWGRVPGPNSVEKKQRIAEVRGVLPEGDKGNAERGHAVFKAQCAGCHQLFGEGAPVGPELTGVERGNLDFLLTSLVDPSALIRKEYQAQSIALKDGRVLSGLVVEENAKALTLFEANQQKTVLSRSEIEEMRPSAASLMPEGLLDKLPDDQVRDLFRYLQSSGPSRH